MSACLPHTGAHCMAKIQHFRGKTLAYAKIFYAEAQKNFYLVAKLGLCVAISK